MNNRIKLGIGIAIFLGGIWFAIAHPTWGLVRVLGPALIPLVIAVIDAIPIGTRPSHDASVSDEEWKSRAKAWREVKVRKRYKKLGIRAAVAVGWFSFAFPTWGAADTGVATLLLLFALGLVWMFIDSTCTPDSPSYEDCDSYKEWAEAHDDWRGNYVDLFP